MLAGFFKFTKVLPIESPEVFCKDPLLALFYYMYLFSSTSPYLLPYFLSSAALLMLTILLKSSSPLVPIAGEALQGALIRLECWSVHWCSLSSSKMRPSWLNPNKLIFSPTSPCSTLLFNPTPTSRITLDYTRSFSTLVSSPKAKSFPPPSTLSCISASS